MSRLALAAGLVALTLLLLPSRGSLAAYGDTSTLTTGTVQAPTVAPVVTTCSGGGLLALPTISWAAPTTGAPVTGYRVTYTGGGITGSSTADVAAGQTSWQPPSTLLAVGTYTITVQTRSGTWLSSASNSQTMSVLNLLVGLTGSCA